MKTRFWGVKLPAKLIDDVNAECNRQGRTRQFVTAALFDRWLEMPADERELELMEKKKESARGV